MRTLHCQADQPRRRYFRRYQRRKRYRCPGWFQTDPVRCCFPADHQQRRRKYCHRNQRPPRPDHRCTRRCCRGMHDRSCPGGRTARRHERQTGQCKESLGSGREIKAGLLLSGFNTKNACGIQFFLQAFLRYFLVNAFFVIRIQFGVSTFSGGLSEPAPFSHIT